ncbi:hypothetical protein [Mycobacterium aquaticum]|nr:hypothetical protein [Mycobacterium aquaticum]
MSAGVKCVVMWFLAVCVPVSIPFAVVVAVGVLSSCFSLLLSETLYLPLFERLTGLGQLLPTGLALLYAGSKDLFSADAPARSTPKGKALYGVTWFFAAIVLVVVTMIQLTVLQKHGSVPYDTQQVMAWISLLIFAICAVIAFTNIYLSTPVPTPASAPASADQAVTA